VIALLSDNLLETKAPKSHFFKVTRSYLNIHNIITLFDEQIPASLTISFSAQKTFLLYFFE